MSILDKSLSSGEKKITENYVQKLLGLVDRSKMYSLFKNLMRKSNLVGVIVKDIGIEYMAQLIRGIEEIGRVYKYDILFFPKGILPPMPSKFDVFFDRSSGRRSNK